jgi:hypothetical protein
MGSWFRVVRLKMTQQTSTFTFKCQVPHCRDGNVKVKPCAGEKQMIATPPTYA